MATKDYDVAAAFQAIEYELINSFFRNMKKHKVDEVTEQKEWEMWQVKQLQELDLYKKRNAKKYGTKFTDINKTVEEMIRLSNEEGQMDQEAEILTAVKDGLKPERAPESLTAQFFRTNDRKLDTLIDATVSDMEKAETAILRKAEDVYRKTIFNAAMYAASGAGTYEKAVDMATKDFMKAGLTCVEYKNGSKHSLSDYADMAVRTANKRAYLQGEGTKRREWGIHTVIVNKRLNACPHCMPFAGKVFIDDVWGGGTAADGDYPLLSEAVKAGLYHPRCKDSHTAYFPGISDNPERYTKQEVKEAEKQEKLERKADYAERQAESSQRVADTRLDPENKKVEQAKADKWKEEAAKIEQQEIDEAFEYYVSGDGMFVNNYLAGRYEEMGATWTEQDQEYLELLDKGTQEDVKQKKLWRSVDASAVFGNMSDLEYDDLRNYMVYGESSVPKSKAATIRQRLEAVTDKTISEPRFMSTTTDKELAMGWGDFSGSGKPIVLELDVPDGIKGADLQRFDLPDDPQNEVLLHRGQKYQVKSVVAEDGNIVVKARLVPESEYKLEVPQSIKDMELDPDDLRWNEFEAHEGGKMSAAQNNPGRWGKAIPQSVSKKDIADLIELGNELGVRVVHIDSFDGDKELFKSVIGKLSELHTKYPVSRKNPTITITDFLNDKDYAETTKSGVIRINKVCLRNRSITEENMRIDNIFQSSKVEDIITHEYGHVLVRRYGNRGVEITRKAYYNITGKEITADEALNYLSTHISNYATQYVGDYEGDFFSGRLSEKKYAEIIPEVLVKHTNSQNDFTEEFIRLLLSN